MIAVGAPARQGNALPQVIESEADVTRAVLDAMAATGNARLAEIMAAFVRHLHAFAREARPTEQEFEQGIAFLNSIGQATDEGHNEGVLFCDAVGLSTLVCLLNNGQGGATETAAALLGPFWRQHSPRTESGGSIVRSPTEGPGLLAECRVTDQQGRPLAGVEVDVWHSSPVGLYENQDDEQASMNLRGKFITDADGGFSFRSVKPAGYPVPTHGPTGDLLRAQGRHPYRPAHLHFLCFKPDFKTLITQVFVADDPNIGSDVVFGVTRPLIGDYQRHEIARPDMAAPWYSLKTSLVMEPGEAVLPHPPIA